MTEQDERDLREFLSNHPVPPGPGGDFSDWEARCKDLAIGVDPSVMLDVLARNGYSEQYGALLALRLAGVEAWAEGYGPDLIYRVRPAGSDWIEITPALP